MFKRPKGVSDTDSSPSPGSSGTQAASVAPKQTPPDINPEERDADSGPARSVTPSYQARKPTVRTLQ